MIQANKICCEVDIPFMFQNIDRNYRITCSARKKMKCPFSKWQDKRFDLLITLKRGTWGGCIKASAILVIRLWRIEEKATLDVEQDFERYHIAS